MIARIRRHGWKFAVHALLLTLGLLNVYPFLWMTATSLKTDKEAISGKGTLLLERKYQLSATAAPAGDEAAFNQRQRDLLAFLVKESAAVREMSRTFIPPRVDARSYASRFQLYREVDLAGKPAREIDLALATRELDDLTTRGRLETVHAQFENYAFVLRDMRFTLNILVSLVVAMVVVFIAVLMSSMLGYALSRWRFPGKFLVLGLLVIGAVAPRDAVYVPIFMMFQSLGLFDGLWGMVLWMSSVSIGNSLLMAGYFLSLPKEVEEAAAVDGAGPIRTFFSISLPMARPIVTTVALFAFLGAWNEFLVPYLCTMSRPELQPLAVAVYSFKNQNPDLWNLTNAAAAIMVLPVIVLFLFVQRTLVNAIAVGAVKG